MHLNNFCILCYIWRLLFYMFAVIMLSYGTVNMLGTDFFLWNFQMFNMENQLNVLKTLSNISKENPLQKFFYHFKRHTVTRDKII